LSITLPVEPLARSYPNGNEIEGMTRDAGHPESTNKGNDPGGV